MRWRATIFAGNAIYLTSSDILASGLSIHGRESIPDIAKNLENFADIILARVYSHTTIETLAKNSKIPVINALCDLHHPTQTLADLYTIWDIFNGFPKDLKIAYVGDACNTANSLLLGCDVLGINFSIASPYNFSVPIEILDMVQNGCIECFTDPVKAVEDADIVYTDTWISMGCENETHERLEIFKPFQLNSKLLSYAKNSAKVMHCLPAHRGEEITESVIDGPNSIVFKQSKAKLLIAKSLIKFLTSKS